MYLMKASADPDSRAPRLVEAAHAEAKYAMEVRSASLRFGSASREVQAFENVSFTIAPGRFVAIVGPSGCGKSSLLMTLAGLRPLTGGEILCEGKPMTKPDPDRIGVVFQEANLYPWLTAQQNVEFPLELKRVAKDERSRAAREALALVGLADFGNSRPHELSGGMKQRVSIARGLVQDPPVLLMDEPFAALDEQTRLTMGDELLRIWAKTAKTIVFVTHGLSEAVYLADEIIVMSARPGRVVDRIDVNLPRPRTHQMMSTPLFNQLRERIWDKIRH
ncbi:MAG TPA: ABC transporter ATP-binding protein [Ramlibacter sp.]|uniref:ABC transporter ATP-binding protein n=1 Tax=Ramlibacter sp. TaxID=1917967 RepID=UPI002C9FE03F|nr:ABC transporter ATP-binding protein [Ramlibacter sp.]HVZ45419.1 ABC transporter ATP-binding protein [Ramlibacter sp.]